MIGDIVKITDGEGRKRSHTIVECLVCGIEFPKPTRFLKKRSKHYCSYDCLRESRNGREIAFCSVCSKSHERRVSQQTKSGLTFCSRKCKDYAQRSDVQMLKCGPARDGTANYRDRALRHYGTKCEWCGYDFERLLDVHHIDRNRANGTIENLIVLCVFCHALDTRNIVRVGSNRELVIVEADCTEQLEKHFGSCGVLLDIAKPRMGLTGKGPEIIRNDFAASSILANSTDQHSVLR